MYINIKSGDNYWSVYGQACSYYMLSYKFTIQMMLVKLKNTTFNEALNTFDPTADLFDDTFAHPSFHDPDYNNILPLQEGVRAKLRVIWQRRIVCTPHNNQIQKKYKLTFRKGFRWSKTNRAGQYTNESPLCFIAWISHMRIPQDQAHAGVTNA
jgi:hypothetical protein